jgi:hypothetical protein
LFDTFRQNHNQIVLKKKTLLTLPCLDKIKEEAPEHNIDYTNDQIIALGMLKTVLSMKLKTINRKFLALLKQLEDNREELV